MGVMRKIAKSEIGRAVLHLIDVAAPKDLGRPAVTKTEKEHVLAKVMQRHPEIGQAFQRISDYLDALQITHPDLLRANGVSAFEREMRPLVKRKGTTVNLTQPKRKKSKTEKLAKASAGKAGFVWKELSKAEKKQWKAGARAARKAAKLKKALGGTTSSDIERSDDAALAKSLSDRMGTTVSPTIVQELRKAFSSGKEVADGSLLGYRSPFGHRPAR